MYLRFEHVTIKGFQSIGYCNVDLSNQGIVSIEGINEYDSFTNSNGSGKSSIFEAIYWSLFGKTTKGVLKPVNRYTSDGCCVSLTFYVDSDMYIVTRAINDKDLGNSLEVIQNGVNISGRNKTDTDKILQNQILKEFTSDIFLSIVFLSQGFNNRLSILSPSGRKDRLETLSQISSKIENFKFDLSFVKSEYDSKIFKFSQDISKSVGEKSSCERELFRLEQIIKDVQSTNRPDINLEETQSKINKLKKLLESLQNSVDNNQKNYNEVNLSLTKLSNDKRNYMNEQAKYQKLLIPVNTKCCPTCGQRLTSELSDKLINEYKDKLSEIVSEINSINESMNSTQKSLNEISNSITVVNNKVTQVKDKISELTSLVIEYLKVRDVSSEQDHAKELKSQIHDFDVNINNNEQEKSNITDLKKVVEHCEGLVSKQFRNYLLEDVIKFINSRLAIYSKMLYSNDSDIIYLKSDSSKLDIYLGDAIYDTLSGGEGRKVDLALSLAQRDLALNLSGSSSNLLILDEIMDNLDDKAISSVTSMFISAADDIDSMFIISHMKLADIPFDSKLTIIKGSDKISKIMRS